MRSFSTRAVGLLILVLGVWGGLAPFVAPYFHFTLGPTKSWTWTSGRLYLDVLPGIAAVLGGLMLIGAGPRRSARLGALLALAGGIWFAIGPDVSLLWDAAGAQGAAHGSKTVRVLEMLTYHTGLGVLIAALAGYALPRFVPAREVVPEAAPATDRDAAYAATDRDAAYASTAYGERDRAVVAPEASTGRLEPAAADTRAQGVPDTRASEPIDQRGEPARVPERGAGGYSEPASANDAPATVADGSAGGRGATGAGVPVADQTGEHTGGTYVGRRRRGGLLSPFLRR
jgi:hypothetical protein